MGIVIKQHPAVLPLQALSRYRSLSLHVQLVLLKVLVLIFLTRLWFGIVRLYPLYWRKGYLGSCTVQVAGNADDWSVVSVSVCKVRVPLNMLVWPVSSCRPNLLEPAMFKLKDTKPLTITYTVCKHIPHSLFLYHIHTKQSIPIPYTAWKHKYCIWSSKADVFIHNILLYWINNRIITKKEKAINKHTITTKEAINN